MQYPPEPFRIKVTEPIRLIPPEARKAALIAAGYNTFTLKAEDVIDSGFEALVRARACIGFVAAHDRRPLLGAHRAGAGVGQQVDEDVLCVEGEEVVARRLKRGFALFARDQADRFNRLDAKRFGGIGCSHFFSMNLSVRQILGSEPGVCPCVLPFGLQ